MQNYNKKFSGMCISKVCKLAVVNIYQLPSEKGFDSENRHFCTCNVFTLKQRRNNICKMAHLLTKDTERAYPEQMLKILSTGVSVSVTKPEGGKRGHYPKQPRVSFLAFWGLMREYCQRKIRWCQRRNKTTMRKFQKGRRATMKAYGRMRRTSHLMTSGIMERARKIVV